MSLHHPCSDTSPDHTPYRGMYHYRHDSGQLAVRHARVNGRHVGDSSDYPDSYRGDGGSAYGGAYDFSFGYGSHQNQSQQSCYWNYCYYCLWRVLTVFLRRRNLFEHSLAICPFPLHSKQVSGEGERLLLFAQSRDR